MSEPCAPISTATPTSLRPTSRTRCGERRSRSSSASPACAVDAGDIRARQDLAEPQPRLVAEQREEAATRRDLDRRERPSPRLEAAADRPRPTSRRLCAQTWLPSASSTTASASRTRSRPPAVRSSPNAETRTSTASTRAYVATSGFGAPEQLVAEQSATADSPMPVSRIRPGDKVATEAALRQARQDPLAPHRPHLARRSGERDDHAAVRGVDPPAGRGSIRDSGSPSPTG